MEASSTAQPPTMSWEMLEKSLAHPNVLIRQKAIETAGRYGDVRSLAALHSAVRDEDARIRTAAAQAFVDAVARRHPDIDTALAGWITSGSGEELRRFLISISGASTSEALQQAIIESLVDPSPKIRAAAETALSERGEAWTFTPAANAAMAAFDRAARSNHPEASAAARAWSEKLRRSQVRRTMLETGVAGILTLTTALRAASPVMRAGAAWALSQSHDGRAIPALVDALLDPDESVRRAAATSLALIRWGASTDEERARQLVALGRWTEAVAAGSCAVDALVFTAAHARAATAVRAIEALAELASVRSLPPLQDLLKSPEPAVRRAAALALKSMEWVPATDSQAITHAIELEDWPAAAAVGAEAVSPLVAILKQSLGQPERAAAITGALATINDPAGAVTLIACCRDGEVAAAAARALEQLLDHAAADLLEPVLAEIGTLTNVVQFQFTLDPQYQQLVRSGLELVSVDRLQQLAAAEAARRTASPNHAEAS